MTTIVFKVQERVEQGLLFGADEFPVENSRLGTAPSFQINAGMVTLGREAKGYTQKDLAGQIGCNQSRVSRIESGELMPQESDLQNLVRTLGRTRDFFFQQGATMPASVSFYRKTQTLPLKMLRQCNAEMNICRLEIEQKVGSANLGELELPYLPPETNGGVKAVAQSIRRRLGIEKGAVRHVTQLIESMGCVVVEYPFPSTKLDGLCIRDAQKPPIVFLHKDSPKSRRRFSLAHELGHLVMHTNPHENVEDEASEFAAEFLMPSAEIEMQFNGLNLDRLGQLKKQWGVSMQAILYRAKKLGKISESYNRFLWMQIGKCGYRVNEPFEDLIPDEKPTELDKRLKTNT